MENLSWLRSPHPGSRGCVSGNDINLLGLPDTDFLLANSSAQVQVVVMITENIICIKHLALGLAPAQHVSHYHYSILFILPSPLQPHREPSLAAWLMPLPAFVLTLTRI